MRVLVTGANGQVGRELQRTCPDGVDLTAYDLDKLDITRQDQIRRVLDETHPALVVNAAAYTAVDRAEQERDLALLRSTKRERRSWLTVPSKRAPG